MSTQASSDSSISQAVDNTSDLIAVRRAKLEAMRNTGFDPFNQSWAQTHFSQEAIALFDEKTESGPEVSVAGRIVAFRLMGKASFIKILDRDGLIQAYVTRDDIGEAEYPAFKALDLGDIVGIRGPLFKTKTGEVTVRANAYGLVSKALRPLPEKWHGIADEEVVYRQRYLDLIVNPQSRERFLMRSKIVAHIRKFLGERGFVELETPFLQNIPGGASARPFKTHMNALDYDFYIRISLELYLKRMLVAGFDRVFEMGRIFRNEGISRKHNPEFTMLEVYQAYSDYRGMMTFIYDLIQSLCKDVLGKTELKRYDGQIINLAGPWKEIRYRDAVIEELQDPEWFGRTKADKLERARALGLDVSDKLQDFEVTHEIYSKRIEVNLIQPTFVTHLPRELCPLAKNNAEDPTVLDVFELCINGQEIAPAYSELNDPLLQREHFTKQVGEDLHNMDEDFLAALEHGMPPAGGLGLGVDRLCMLLTEGDTIRDTILFPAMRAEHQLKDVFETKAKSS